MTDPKSLREGDRVRITLEGDFINVDSDGDFHFRFDGGRSTWFPLDSLSHAEITCLDPPIRVGDRVRHIHGDKADDAVVLAIDEDMAWVKWVGGPRQVSAVSSLTRISEES